mmetsp:Transcript_50103/g.106570  ORF Transcript_50103/g.106570 Transcript_50103/m.106570 type:complete len:509 (+) Transcript_50103:197-1723(+)|eukprot:CAMPEP_0206491272 /NCGR_PEP_ID=MMETSP0324_2-20121206/44841_1 /ASSEMBLY_ACC=CAM_ASM_000836 /TAXON_ID=2866 /ORGANISM="Crypthecodinium cohnii, Strain Seligo" /LENGTH=508 /DNA_ID=CAMNT_0053972319 /DNA_START=133 /DNA_END=1659 /DNA_ORIENTATION=-
MADAAAGADGAKKKGLTFADGPADTSTASRTSTTRVRIDVGGAAGGAEGGARPASTASSALTGLLKGSSSGAAATLQNLAAASSGGGGAAGEKRGSTGHARWSIARSGVFAYRSLGGMSNSFFLEKQGVVIEFGTAFTKVGFAAEASPRHIIPTPELNVSNRSGSAVSSTLLEAEWIDILERLLQKIFFHYLSVSPKDRRVIVAEPVFAPTHFRNALAYCLFKRYNVPSASFVIDLVMPLYLTGLHSGLVIDCGHTSSRVLATLAGVPVITAFRTADGGGHRIARTLAASIKAAAATNPKETVLASKILQTPKLAQDVMVQCCYATFSSPAGDGLPEINFKSENSVNVVVEKGGETITVPAASRWQCCEHLFKDIPNKSEHEQLLIDEGCADIGACDSLVEAIVQCLENCPTDVRAAVIQNVLVVGGCASIRGLLPRLALECRAALSKIPAMATIADRIRFTPLDHTPVTAVWVGASILAHIDGGADISLSDYMEGKRLPDWSRDGFL